MDKKLLITAAIFGLLAVVLGAFAAHGLKSKVDSDAIESFNTGVRYQMYHALLLLLVASSSYLSKNAKKLVWIFIALGLLLFSGSIYGLATDSLTSIDFKAVAFITPIGGLLLIIAWIILLINFLKIKL